MGRTTRSVFSIVQAVVVTVTGLGSSVAGLSRFVTLGVVLTGIILTATARIVRSYRRHPDWAELPSHHRAAVIAVEVLSCAAFGAMVDLVLGRGSNDPRWNQVDATVAAVAHHQAELHRVGGYSDIKAAIKGFLRLHREIGTAQGTYWAQNVFPVAFPVVFLIGSMFAAVHLIVGLAGEAKLPFLVILTSAMLSLFLAGTFHLAIRPKQHQLSMMATGATVLALSLYLWHTSTGFESDVPDVLGRVVGVSMGLSILVWQSFARTDPEGERSRCRAAAAVVASCGITLAVLNVLDGLLAPRVGVEALSSLVWPLCIVAGATLAAMSPPGWRTGSRAGAMYGNDERYHGAA